MELQLGQEWRTSLRLSMARGRQKQHQNPTAHISPAITYAIVPVSLTVVVVIWSQTLLILEQRLWTHVGSAVPADGADRLLAEHDCTDDRSAVWGRKRLPWLTVALPWLTVGLPWLTVALAWLTVALAWLTIALAWLSGLLVRRRLFCHH